MPRKPALLVLGIFLFLFLFSQKVQAFSFTNGGFENGLDSWKESSVNSQIVTDIRRSGEKCASVSAKTGDTYSHYLIQENIDINKSKRYKINGYIKKGNDQLKGALVRVAWYPSSGGQLDTIDSNEVTSDNWELANIDTVPHKDAAKMTVRLAIKSVNSSEEALVYFDDVEVVEYDPPTATPFPTDTPSPTLTLAPTDSPKPTPTPPKTPTPSKTPTPKKTPTPSKTPTPTKKLSPTPARKTSPTPTKKKIIAEKNNGGKILGEEAGISTSSSFVSHQSDELVQILVLTGVLFGIASVAAYFYNKFQTPLDQLFRRKFKKE